VRFLINWVLDLFRKPEEEIPPFPVEKPKRKPQVKKATTRTKKPVAKKATPVAKKTTKAKIK
jgi:hypothetical protein